MEETAQNTLHIVTLEGKFLSEYDFREVLSDVEEKIALGQNKVIINLDSLVFINSSGIGALINILTKARTAGGESVIAGGNEQTSKLLVITKLSQIFRVFESVSKAKEYFNK